MISTQPYKGTRDLLPNDFAIQKFIFDTWREVCLRFGYKEYLTPTMELADLYRAKSGVLKDELFIVRDRANRELALRPEMTPSITRLVSSIYKEEPKPIRLFSIANFFRNEAPQKGRYREFWQLNVDIFGEDSVLADLEIMVLCIEIMLAFNAPLNSFMFYFNNRILIDDFLKQYVISKVDKSELTRVMDKFTKMPQADFTQMLLDMGLNQKESAKIILFLTSTTNDFKERFPELLNSTGFNQITFAEQKLTELGYSGYFDFRPDIVRGIDYYDGMVFEVFDQNPTNNRSLYGGGRYNGLSEIFGVENFSATGVALGNVTTQIFLENWGLLPNLKQPTLLCPIMDMTNVIPTLTMVNKLRRAGLKIEVELNQKSLSDTLRKANKKGCSGMIILGEDEIAKNEITIKNLETGIQETKSFEIFLSEIS